MNQETKSQIIRVSGLTGVAFAAVLIITGFSNRSERVASEPEGFETYDDVVFNFDAKVASLQRRFDAEPTEIDWAHIEALEQKKRIEAPEKPVQPKPIENETRSDTPPEELIPEPPPAPMILNGVVWSDQAPLAFVNDRVLRLHDSYNSFTVTAIEENGITLTDGKGNQTRMNLYEPRPQP